MWFEITNQRAKKNKYERTQCRQVNLDSIAYDMFAVVACDEKFRMSNNKVIISNVKERERFGKEESWKKKLNVY